MPSARRWLSRIAVLCCVLMGGLALCCGAALAVNSHQFLGSFGPGGPGVIVEGVAVDGASGSVYVLDAAGQGRLYKFDSKGHPQEFSGLSGSGHPDYIEGTRGTGNAES